MADVGRQPRDVVVTVDVDSIPDRLAALTLNDTGQSPSRYLQQRTTREQSHECMVHRSVYQLKKADRIRGESRPCRVAPQPPPR